MKRDDQRSLFSHQILAQPRKREPESALIWDAIRTLRLAGHSVYRAGIRDHLVDGRRLGERQLISLAKRKQRLRQRQPD